MQYNMGQGQSQLSQQREHASQQTPLAQPLHHILPTRHPGWLGRSHSDLEDVVITIHSYVTES